MAASVENHRFTNLTPAINGVVSSYISNHHANSPICFHKPVFIKDQKYYSDSDDEEEEKENIEYYRELVRKSDNNLEPSILDPRDESTVDKWIHRNPTMIRLTGKHPFNSETQLTRLMHHGFITPVPLHYVRNHGAVPRANWSDWTVEVTGLVRHPTKFTMDELVSEFNPREFPATLVCAGNRRKEQNMVNQSIGFNWGSAAVSTSVWRGVPLVDILKKCGILKRENMLVCFEGAEDLPGGGGSKYGTSIRREFAIDRSRDIVLAYMQNNEVLKPDHGFPVRIIIPGFIGGRMVKWLKRIIVTTTESESHYHFKDNRMFPSHVDAELANSEAWWYKPEYLINELNINSVITTPSHSEILPINPWTSQRPYTLKGYAYSGGGKKVIRVEVTMDGGETWQLCEVDHAEKGNKYGKYWCWCFWSVQVEVLDLLGAKEIAVRAWDETQNTQPEKLIWNLMGMMNNCWFRVRTNICKPHKGEIGILFEHPTQPGNQPGGWMAKERQSSNESNQTLKKSISSPFMNTTSKTYSIADVKKHNSNESAWIIVHGHVYDCTKFLKEHPGGSDAILINAGTDCTEEFDAIHSAKAKILLEDYRIGELIYASSDSSPDETMHGSTIPLKTNVALVNPRDKISCKLIKKTSISHNVRCFRFALPCEDHVLGLPIGKHIFVSSIVDDKLCMRAYSPITTADQVGYFELVVKIYLKGTHPKFPNGGLMSQYLDSLPLGSVVDVKGPLGSIEYTGRGNFMVNGKPKSCRKVAMIAGGTGITPIYQVMQAILQDPLDQTEMYLVYTNRTENDILLREELDNWADKYKERVKVWYVVSKSLNEGWGYSTGPITESILREHIPDGSDGCTLALACGPPAMIKSVVQPNLETLKYDIKENFLVF